MNRRIFFFFFSRVQVERHSKKHPKRHQKINLDFWQVPVLQGSHSTAWTVQPRSTGGCSWFAIGTSALRCRSVEPQQPLPQWHSVWHKLTGFNQLLAGPASSNKKAAMLMLTFQESEIVNNSHSKLQRMRMGLWNRVLPYQWNRPHSWTLNKRPPELLLHSLGSSCCDIIFCYVSCYLAVSCHRCPWALCNARDWYQFTASWVQQLKTETTVSRNPLNQKKGKIEHVD